MLRLQRVTFMSLSKFFALYNELLNQVMCLCMYILCVCVVYMYVLCHLCVCVCVCACVYVLSVSMYANTYVHD